MKPGGAYLKLIGLSAKSTHIYIFQGYALEGLKFHSTTTDVNCIEFNFTMRLQYEYLINVSFISTSVIM